MNPYELIRPDGAATGVWACGECHLPHGGVTLAGRPASDSNRQSAERCCAPRTCHYCGKTTERDPYGQYAIWHEACIPKYEPTPPHPSMANPWARLLYRRMSDISQDFWCAGWISGNEFDLWEALQSGTPRPGNYNPGSDDIEELRLLSERAQGWIFTGPEKEYEARLVTFEEWEPIFAEGKTRRQARADER